MTFCRCVVVTTEAENNHTYCPASAEASLDYQAPELRRVHGRAKRSTLTMITFYSVVTFRRCDDEKVKKLMYYVSYVKRFIVISI